MPKNQDYRAKVAKSAAKSNHSAVCKWVSAEAQKIVLGVDSLFDGQITSSSILSTFNSGGNPMGSITNAIV